MNVLVCVKRVPLTGGKIVLTDDQRAISTRHLGFTISPHEECAWEVAGGRDAYVVAMPALITVKEGLNLPRYPSVPGRLRAKRKPLAALTPTRPDPRLEMVRLTLPPGSGKQAQVLGDGADAAPAVV